MKRDSRLRGPGLVSAIRPGPKSASEWHPLRPGGRRFRRRQRQRESAKKKRNYAGCSPLPTYQTPATRGSLGRPLSGKCALQAFDIEFLQLQHGLKGPLGFCGVRIGEQLRQDLGYNLPGEAKLILQPAALLRLRIAALGQPLPVVIHFLLGRALNLKRDGLVELENGSTVERGEGLSVQLKGHRQHRPGRLPVDFLSGLRIARDGDDFRVFENGGVKAGGVFGLVVEPQAGADLCGHDFSVVLGFRNVIVHLVDEQEVRVRTSGANFSKSWHESTCEMLLAYAGIVWSYAKSRAKIYAK